MVTLIRIILTVAFVAVALRVLFSFYQSFKANRPADIIEVEAEVINSKQHEQKTQDSSTNNNTDDTRG